MRRISSTLNAVHEGIIKHVKSMYDYRDKNMVVKDYLLRGTDEVTNDLQTGIFYEIEEMYNTSQFYCIVKYHLIEISYKRDINSQSKLMNNLDTKSYGVGQTGQNQIITRSEPITCVVNYHDYTIETEDKEVKEIEVEYKQTPIEQ